MPPTAVAVVNGSLPLGTPDGYYRELILRTPCPMVLDFRGPGLLGVLDLEPLVVKPNRQELAETLGRPLGTDEELRSAMGELNRRGARWVIVTRGSGPVWLSSAASVHRFQPPTVSDVVNPLGCGDAMAATVAWAVHEGRDIPEAVRLGIAAADNLRHVLPCRFDRDAVLRMVEQVRALP